MFAISSERAPGLSASDSFFAAAAASLVSLVTAPAASNDSDTRLTASLYISRAAPLASSALRQATSSTDDAITAARTVSLAASTRISLGTGGAADPSRATSASICALLSAFIFVYS